MHAVRLQSDDRPVSGAALKHQCRVLQLSCAPVYRRQCELPEADLALMRRIHVSHLEYPYPGNKQLRDIMYLPMRHGFVYLDTLLDRASRIILSFLLSNSLTTDF